SFPKKDIYRFLSIATPLRKESFLRKYIRIYKGLSGLLANARILGERRPLAVERIDGCRLVRMADRHAAEDHLVLRHGEVFADHAVPHRPGLLRTGVQPVLAREQHDVLEKHPEIRPLALLHLAVDREDEAHGRAEERPVSGEELQPRRLVLA